MTDTAYHLLSYAITAGISGLVVWVWTLWRSHYAFREHVANTYVKSEDVGKKLDKFEIKFDEFQKTIGRIHELIAEMKGQSNATGKRKG